MNKSQRLLEACGVNEFFKGAIYTLFKALSADSQKHLTAALNKQGIDLEKMDVPSLKLANNRDPRIKDPNFIKLVHFKAPDDSDALAIYSGRDSGEKLNMLYGSSQVDPGYDQGRPVLKGPDGALYTMPASYSGKLANVCWGNILQFAQGIYVIDKNASKKDAALLNTRYNQKKDALGLDRDQSKQSFNQSGWDRANDPNDSYGYKPGATRADFWQTQSGRRGNSARDKSGYLVNPSKYKDLLASLKAEKGIVSVVDDAIQIYEEITKYITTRMKAMAAGSKATRLLTDWSSDDLSYQQRNIVSSLDDLSRELVDAERYQAAYDVETNPEKKKSLEWSINNMSQAKRKRQELVEYTKNATSALKKAQAEG